MTGIEWAYLISAIIGAGAAYQASATNKKVAENNAKVAEFAARDAERRGESEAMRVRREADALKARQRTIMAARGLDLGEGTAQDIQDQTDFFSIVDQATARDNARKEAWGKRMYGAGYSAQAAGENPYRSAGLAFMSSGGGKVADKWYTNRGAPGDSIGAAYGGGSGGNFLTGGY